MSQITRPAEDVSTGFWSDAPLYPKLNGALPGGSKVTSRANPAGDTFEVKVANLAQTCCDGATLSVALRKTEAGSLPTSMALLQGNMVIAGQEVEPSQSFGNVDLTLSPEQVCKITDPTGLSVRIMAGRPPIGCCPDIPALLTATIHNVVDCEVLEGVTVPLCWNGVDHAWKGSEIVCGMPLDISLLCGGSSATSFSLFGHWGSGGCTIPFGNISTAPSACSPFFLHFLGNMTVSGNCPCCTNTTPTFDVDVTA